MHEEPQVPNFDEGLRDSPKLKRGMTIAIEPMVNAGGANIKILKDGWTVVTQDGSLSAHFEHSVLVTDGEPEILTWAKTPSSSKPG
jgi:methionyl aminopeptidase